MKEISGRKYITMATVSTYCFVIVGSVVMVVMKLMSVETFLALNVGLGSVVMYITKAYFDDKDRSLEKKEN